MGLDVFCKFCGKEVKKRKNSYCDSKCYWDSMKGKDSFKDKIFTRAVPWNKGVKGIHLSPNSEFKKGEAPWNKGTTLSEEHKQNLSLSHKGPRPWRKGVKIEKNTGENHFLWKGEEVGYDALHSWMSRTYGKANKCENFECFYPRVTASKKILYEPSGFEWSNISGEYKRNRDDWEMLCIHCHRLKDLSIKIIQKYE